MESFELASRGSHSRVLFLLPQLAGPVEDSAVLVRHLDLLLSVSGSVLALLVLIVRLEVDLVPFLGQVPVAACLAHDVPLHLHCSLLLLLGNSVHVEGGGVNVVRVVGPLAFELVKRFLLSFQTTLQVVQRAQLG